MSGESQDLRVPLSLTVAAALGKALFAVSPQAKTVFLQELATAATAFELKGQGDVAALIGQYAQMFREEAGSSGGRSRPMN